MQLRLMRRRWAIFEATLPGSLFLAGRPVYLGGRRSVLRLASVEETLPGSLFLAGRPVYLGGRRSVISDN